MNRMIIAPLLIVSLAYSINLTDSSENYDSFMRTHGDLSGDEVIYYWTGSIYSFVPGERSLHLFEADGFNIGQLKE